MALDLKIVAAAGTRMARGEIDGREVLSSWNQVLDYCRAAMAFEEREQFRILFLDKKNALIADEVQQTGTVDHTPVYPREVVRRALELSATAIILVHNHPSGDPTPSRADIDMTKTIVETAQAARHRRPRPHHHRQEGPCQHEGPAADLALPRLSRRVARGNGYGYGDQAEHGERGTRHMRIFPDVAQALPVAGFASSARRPKRRSSPVPRAPRRLNQKLFTGWVKTQ